MTVVKYYDLDKQKDSSRMFSMIEKKRMSDILDAIDKVLADYHHPGPDGENKIEGYLPSMGTCSCSCGAITFYDIRLKSSVLSLGEIEDIAEELHKLDVILINVNAYFPLKRFSLYIGELHGHNHKPEAEE